MKNPLSALPMFSPDVPQGTFTRNFVKGAGSGALMMGIFSGLGGISAALIGFGTPFGWGMVGMMALGSLATGLFTGITATQRAAEASRSASTVSHEASRREPIARAPEHAVAPHIQHAAHNSRVWQEKVGAGHQNTQSRVSQILADRSLSDGDRAAAILRDREQSSALESHR